MTATAEQPRSEEKVKMNYPSNSHREREANKQPEEPRRPKVEKVISGKVSERKKPLGTRIAENFGGEDLQSVGSHVVMNVLLPAAKDMMFEAVKEGFARAIFGDSARGRSSSSSRGDRGSAFTPYNSYSKTKSDRPTRETSARDSDYTDIAFEDRGDAEAVLDQLVMIIEEYNFVTVADLYECAGKTPPFTAAKYGWSNLSSAKVDREAGGYYLNLPKARWVE
ncbi:hypothetical protein SEA_GANTCHERGOBLIN_50 [Arthrobacter phage GantcherGoblin]|nr:hypothetical protein SEA_GANTCHERGOBLIN_50 [Arthrobacter phage GantcherGoblin]